MGYDADQTIWYWSFTCARCRFTNVFFTSYAPDDPPPRVTGSPEYLAWLSAKMRCFNPDATSYRQFGGRGIRMCRRWRYNFRAFLRDMGRRPAGARLARLNENGNYEPSNCQWRMPPSNRDPRRINNLGHLSQNRL